MPDLRMHSTVIDTPEPRRLAAFYVELLGWTYRDPDDDDPGWVVIKPAAADGSPDPLAFGLSFTREQDHRAPVWPTRPGEQQMQAHLDIAVADDLDGAVSRAVALGAVVADVQPQELVRVMLDPSGHPFCLFAPGG